MPNHLQISLKAALSTFQSEAEQLLNSENRVKTKQKRTELLERQMKALAEQFLYGGYINIRGMNGAKSIDRKIYCTSIEFYYHECKEAQLDDASRITDYIMYHIKDITTTELPKDWRDSVLIAGSLHAHKSGVDVTFEDSKDRFRASILIREFVVIEDDKHVHIAPEKHSTFIIHELLEGIPIHVQGKPMRTQWIDLPLIAEVSIKCCARTGVPESELKTENGTSTLVKHKDSDDDRQWQFKRQDSLDFNHIDYKEKKEILHIGLREAFQKDALSIIEEFAIGEVFSSHQFIKKFTQKNHLEYVKALNFYLEVLECNIPFNILHGHIAVSLYSIISLKKVGKIMSTTIFGEEKLIAAWKRKY